MYNLRYITSVHGKPISTLLKCEAGKFVFDPFKAEIDLLNKISHFRDNNQEQMGESADK